MSENTEEGTENKIYTLPSGMEVTCSPWKLIDIKEFLRESRAENFEAEVMKLIKKNVKVVNPGLYATMGVYSNGQMNWEKLIEEDWMPLFFSMRDAAHGPEWDCPTLCNICGHVTVGELDIMADFPVFMLEDDPELHDLIVGGGNQVSFFSEIVGAKVTIIINTWEQSARWSKSHPSASDTPTEYDYLLSKITMVEIKDPNGKVTVYSRKTEDGVLPVSRFLDKISESVAMSLVDEIEDHDFGMRMVVPRTCSKCGVKYDGKVQFNPSFFRPTPKRVKSTQTTSRRGSVRRGIITK